MVSTTRSGGTPGATGSSDWKKKCYWPERRVQLPVWMGAWQPHWAKQPSGAGLGRLERRGRFPLSLQGGAGFP